MDESPRTWGEAVGLFCAAFCGLAAAGVIFTGVIVGVFLLKGP